MQLVLGVYRSTFKLSRYENISHLIEQLQRNFESQGCVQCLASVHHVQWIDFVSLARYLWISNDLIMSEQRGVFRVNCIDCLDRTNVVEVRDRRVDHTSHMHVAHTPQQSAFSRHVLTRQLGSVALQYPSIGPAKVDTDVVFNDGAWPARLMEL